VSAASRVERVDLANVRPQCILHDFLRIGAIAGDTDRQPVRPIAVRRDETLSGSRFTLPERLEQCMIAIHRSRDGRSCSERAVRWFHHECAHGWPSFASRPNVALVTSRGITRPP
jgi:hypothetical protein